MKLKMTTETPYMKLKMAMSFSASCRESLVGKKIYFGGISGIMYSYSIAIAILIHNSLVFTAEPAGLVLSQLLFLKTTV